MMALKKKHGENRFFKNIGSLIKIQFYLTGVFAILFIGVGLVGFCQDSLPSLPQLKEQYDKRYQCVIDRGLATFSAHVSSNQMKVIADFLKMQEPSLTIVFEGVDNFSVDLASPSQSDSQKAIEIQDLSNAVKNAVEGFLYSYELVALSNPFTNISASASVQASGSELIITYPDKTPGQVMTLTFDKDFQLIRMLAKDENNSVSSSLNLKWVQMGGFLILSRLETEFFQGAQSTFFHRMTFENAKFGPFYLPIHVFIQAKDPTSGLATLTNMEFSLSSYQLGISPGSER